MVQKSWSSQATSEPRTQVPFWQLSAVTEFGPRPVQALPSLQVVPLPTATLRQMSGGFNGFVGATQVSVVQGLWSSQSTTVEQALKVF